MATGKWDVPAGTKTNIKTKRKDWKVDAGAIEHKNRPEAIYITLTSWVKPRLQITTAKATSTSDPNELAMIVSKDFEREVERAEKKFASCFDSSLFDYNSIISITDFAHGQAGAGKRQYLNIEINIDTVNTIDRDGQPSSNPANGKVEMYSFKDLQPSITSAVNKILDLEVFNPAKAQVSFSTKKTGK